MPGGCLHLEVTPKKPPNVVCLTFYRACQEYLCMRHKARDLAWCQESRPLLVVVASTWHVARSVLYPGRAHNADLEGIPWCGSLWHIYNTAFKLVLKNVNCVWSPVDLGLVPLEDNRVHSDSVLKNTFFPCLFFVIWLASDSKIGVNGTMLYQCNPTTFYQSEASLKPVGS